MSLINAEKQKTLTGAEIIIKVLKELGIECIFGYPGGIVLGIYDELYKQKDIKHYLVRHEQAAVHADDAQDPSRHRYGVHGRRCARARQHRASGAQRAR